MYRRYCLNRSGHERLSRRPPMLPYQCLVRSRENDAPLSSSSVRASIAALGTLFNPAFYGFKLLSCGSGNDNKKTDQTHNKEDDPNHNASNLTRWMIVGRVIDTYGKGNNAQDNCPIVHCTISHDNNLLKKLYSGETTSLLPY